VTLGAGLQRYRKAKGWSQTKLSVLSGVRQSLISELETGTRQDTRSHIVLKLAQALGVTVEELYEPSEASHEDPCASPHTLTLWESLSL
jgi:transcriptional regulator with XRE-family HTH domain